MRGWWLLCQYQSNEIKKCYLGLLDLSNEATRSSKEGCDVVLAVDGAAPLVGGGDDGPKTEDLLIRVRSKGMYD